MTIHRSVSSGKTLLELLAVLSIIATLMTLLLPAYAEVKRRAYVVRCMAQMNEISLAIKRYRIDHGRPPQGWKDLVPNYLNEQQVICPFTKDMAPQEVQQQRARQHIWSSYFWFSRVGLDDLAKRGAMPLGYTEVLRLRGDETPLVICRDHREPFSVNPFLGIPYHIIPGGGQIDPSRFPQWDFPEQPIVVLRWGGQVELTKKGGTRTHLTTGGTWQDLIEL